jgi:UrcA family protein
MRNSIVSIGTLTALMLGLAAIAPAAAEAPLVSESTAIRYGDLDLDKTAGVAQLYARMRTAAERVCGERYRPGTLVVEPAWRDCVAAAVAAGVAALDRPAVTEYHAAHADPAVAANAARSAVSSTARN